MVFSVNHIDGNNRMNIYSFYLYIEFGEPNDRGEVLSNFNNHILPDGLVLHIWYNGLTNRKENTLCTTTNL